MSEGEFFSPCWVNYTNTAANGAVLLPQYTSIDACVYGCRHEVPDCLAAQWRDVSSNCFAVYDINAILGRFPSPGIGLYVLTLYCMSTGESMSAVMVKVLPHRH